MRGHHLRSFVVALLLGLLPIAGMASPVVAPSGMAAAIQQGHPTDAVQGRALYDAAKYKESVPFFRRAIQSDPTDARSIWDLGLAYSALGQDAAAVTAYQQLLHLQSKPADAYRARADGSLADAYSNLHQYSKAIVFLKEAIHLNPNDIRSSSLLGAMYSFAGRQADSMASWRRTARLQARPARSNPGAAAADYYNRGYASFSIRDIPRARSDFDTALRLNPGYSLNLWYRGWCDLYLTDGAAAARDGRRFLKLSGWKGSDSAYATLIADFGSRMNGDAAGASKLLTEYGAKGDVKAWPYPVMRYLRHEIPAAKLLALATSRAGIVKANMSPLATFQDHAAEAHAYLGLDLLLRVRPRQARPLLEWAKRHGAIDLAESYLASTLLGRLDHRAVAH